MPSRLQQARKANPDQGGKIGPRHLRRFFNRSILGWQFRQRVAATYRFDFSVYFGARFESSSF